MQCKINKISKFAQKPRGPGADKPFSLSLLLYEALLRAENSRIVLLTGTPIINYSNEMSNIRGVLGSKRLPFQTVSRLKTRHEELKRLGGKEAFAIA